MKNIIIAEEFLERLNCDVYPVTLIKFLLNRRRIMSYFFKAASKDFQIRGMRYRIDNSNCERCKEKKEFDFLCRQHASIKRVMNADNVAMDVDTQTFFYKNEIFKMVGNRLVIVYCPHTKLINGEITDEKVRKVNPITVEDPEKELPNYLEYAKTVTFTSDLLLEKNVKGWFNKEFSIITTKGERTDSDFFLVVNR